MAGAGYRTFAAAEVLTAAQVNTFLMQQSVMVFANAAARDAAITSPSEGMVAVLLDVNYQTIHNGTTWVRGVQYGPATSYTVAFTGSVSNPSIGTGGLPESNGFYSLNGNIATGYVRIAAGTTSVTAGSGDYRFSLPVPCKMGVFVTRGVVIGNGYYSDSSAPTLNYVCTAVAVDTGDYCILRTVAGTIGSTRPGLAANDFIQLNFSYEIA